MRSNLPPGVSNADIEATSAPDTFTPDGPAAGDDLRGVVQSDGDVNEAAPAFTVRHGDEVLKSVDNPHDVYNYWLMHLFGGDNLTVNWMRGEEWLIAYDQFKPWLIGGKP